MSAPRTRALSASLLVGLLGAVGLTGCSATSGGQGTASDTLLLATGDAEPTCLDPHVGGNWPQALLGNQVLESLFSRDVNGAIIPWLAESSEAGADGLTHTIHLRPGVKFSDGTPLTAQAVIRNFEHLRDPRTKSSTGLLALQKVAKMTAVDDATVRLELSEPDAALRESLAQTWLAIESPAGLDRGFDANCAAPIGTGPFKVASWTKQEAVRLDRNDGYATGPADAGGAKPGVAHVEWRFIPDASARLAALKSGQVHIIDSVQPDAVAQLPKSGEATVVTGARPGVTSRLELNSRPGEIFADERVRTAFRRSMDLDAAVQSLYFGTLQRSTSVLSSSTPYALPQPEALRADPAEANRLLDEAGWTVRDTDGIRMKDGRRLEVRLPVSTNQSIPAEVSLFEQIAQSAKGVGMQVRMEELDLATWYSRAGAWQFDAISAPYTKSSADVLRIVYGSAGITPAPSGYHANNIGVQDARLDELVNGLGREPDDGRRRQLAEAAQRILVERGYVIPMTDQMVWFAASPRVQGFRLQPNLNVPSLAGVRVEGA